MLQPNLLYTGVTRGKPLVVLVGMRKGRSHIRAMFSPKARVEAGGLVEYPDWSDPYSLTSDELPPQSSRMNCALCGPGIGSRHKVVQVSSAHTPPTHLR
jgi:hypothetical protein